eukprot:CAMPEP_0181439386 /NCGR_PEP_ID=MMETSP1110-20121109/22398_1 /TAXON_ID=174948 /ORGANISM="Symbiodinium sp., Strain CCMP421" /LENGTH=55 /DNA_ID=CAMNT_0023563103 /DNA_START=58 /DNA_END=221 /DNA_ORIENTATION=-
MAAKSWLLPVAVLLALGLLSTAFVAPRPAAPPRGDAMALRAGGEYTGFVPDLQRR